MLASGLISFVPALAFEKAPHSISWQPMAGFFYLVIFGGIIGYSAFVYAMDRLPPAIASIYTYVNPIVALFLGWLFYREPFGWRQLTAMLLIFAGVALVKMSVPRKRSGRIRELKAEIPAVE